MEKSGSVAISCGKGRYIMVGCGEFYSCKKGDWIHQTYFETEGYNMGVSQLVVGVYSRKDG